MSEGELKKRIVAQSNNGLSPEEKDGDINSEDLLQWIDEVRTEFPLKTEQYLDKTGRREWPELSSVDPDEIMKWFVKWFGGEKG